MVSEAIRAAEGVVAFCTVDDRPRRALLTLADYSAGSATYASAYASAYSASLDVRRRSIVSFYAARAVAWAARAMDLYASGIHEEAKEIAELGKNCAALAHKCANSAW